MGREDFSSMAQSQVNEHYVTDILYKAVGSAEIMEIVRILYLQADDWRGLPRS